MVNQLNVYPKHAYNFQPPHTQSLTLALSLQQQVTWSTAQTVEVVLA